MAKKEEKNVKDIGIQVSNPPSRECDDTKCPYHGNLKLRGKVFRGKVVSTKMMNSVVVEWERLYPLQKYERSERRKTRVTAHRPSCIDVHEGDTVRVSECRPLSKTKSFVLFEVIKK